MGWRTCSVHGKATRQTDGANCHVLCTIQALRELSGGNQTGAVIYAVNLDRRA